MVNPAQKLKRVAELGAAAKAIERDIKAFQQARQTFVSSVRERLEHEDVSDTLRILMENNIVGILCCPLTSDIVQGIQTEALQCVGQLGGLDRNISLSLGKAGVMDGLVLAQTHGNPRIKAAANKAVASLSAAGEEVSQAILDSGMLQCVIQQLDGTDTEIKISGLDAVASVALQSPTLAHACSDEQLLDKAIALLNEVETPEKLQKSVCVLLSAIAVHTAELARKVLDRGAVDAAVSILKPAYDTDPKLQAASLHCLAHISCHDSSSATIVSAAGAGEAAIRLAGHSHPLLRHAATALLHQIASHTVQLCKSIASGGCVSVLIASLKQDQGTPFSVAPMLALGHIASSAPTFAQVVIDAGGIHEYMCALKQSLGTVVKAASWGVLHNVLHGPLIATQWAAVGVIPVLLETLGRVTAQKDVYTDVHAAIKEVVKHCSQPNPLFAMVSEGVPEDLATQAMSRLYSIMQESVVGRRDFVTTGSLLKMQQLEQTWGSAGSDCVLAINSLFPRDVVTYYRQTLGFSAGG